MMRSLLIICVFSLMQLTFAINVKYDMLTNIPTPGYICSALNLETKTPGVVITEFIGQHQTGKKDSDVILFDITDQKTDYLPRGLSKKYVNMEILHIMSSGVKAITREDFKPMPKLKELALFNNHIEMIPNNCFDDLVHLERLSFTKNKIKTIPSKFFNLLPNLKAVYLSQNELTAIQTDLFDKNLKLEYIGFRENKLKFIGGNILSKLKNLKDVNFKKNVCIDDSYPRTTLDNLVKTIKTKCNVLPVDPCTSTKNEIAKLQEANKKLAVQQKANQNKINSLQAKCPGTQLLSIESTDSDNLQEKYDELKASYALLESKDCVYSKQNGTSHIELVFHHES